MELMVIKILTRQQKRFKRVSKLCKKSKDYISCMSRKLKGKSHGESDDTSKCKAWGIGYARGE